MQNYLFLHKEDNLGQQEKYRGSYTLSDIEFKSTQKVDGKGNIISERKDEDIYLEIDGVIDQLLAAWLFDPYKKENGAIVTLDENGQNISKTKFDCARISSFRMRFDSETCGKIKSLITISAKEII